MSDAFDPYHVWLGIPPAEQPPNHYRLLALAMFEAAPEVIENAADRQMAHVRRAASGKHADKSQAILNEISAARRCLLNAEMKQEYDAQLQSRESKLSAVSASGKPAKPPAPPPPRKTKATNARAHSSREGNGQAQNGASSRFAAAAGKSPSASVRVAASSSVAQRVRKKPAAPWMTLAIIAALAALPILLLVAALAVMNSRTTTAARDGDRPPASDSADDGTDRRTDDGTDRAADSGTDHGGKTDGDDLPSFPAPPLPQPPTPVEQTDGHDPADLPQPPVAAPDPPDLRRGLVAYWNFDHNGVQRPSVDNGHVGAPDEQVRKNPSSAAAHIDGALRNPVLFYNHAAWMERPAAAFTLALWFRPRSVAGTQSIAGQRDGDSLDREWNLVRSGDSLIVRFHVDDQSRTERLMSSPSGVLTAGKWALAVVRWDKDGRVDGFRQSLWVGGEDGALARRTANLALTLPTTSARFGIGDDDTNYPLDGDIDEAAYWDRALSAEEVKQYYNGGAGLKYPFE